VSAVAADLVQDAIEVARETLAIAGSGDRGGEVLHDPFRLGDDPVA